MKRFATRGTQLSHRILFFLFRRTEGSNFNRLKLKTVARYNNSFPGRCDSNNGTGEKWYVGRRSVVPKEGKEKNRRKRIQEQRKLYVSFFLLCNVTSKK